MAICKMGVMSTSQDLEVLNKAHKVFRRMFDTLCLPGGSDSKESACSVGDWGLIPGSRSSLNKGMAACSSIPGASQVVQW